MKIDEISDLPQTIPLIPLYGSVLLPQAQIPLPLNELEYLGLTSDFFHQHVFVGVAQPIFASSDKTESSLPLYKAGTLGKITDVEEIEDEKIIVTLEGICRFDILTEELVPGQIYRRASVDYTKYKQDLAKLDSSTSITFNRDRLLKALEEYFKHFNLKPNWDEIGDTPNERLISSLAMLCPFEASEKQAVLESLTLDDQTETLTKLIEIGLAQSNYLSLNSVSATFH